MNRILEIDLDGPARRGRAGRREPRRHAGGRGRTGCFYAPDPSSQQVCTIGGNVAENSGGAHCLKNGFTVNHVTGLVVVLPDGELVELGGKALDPDGYDLLGAFVGSEGTLGIATRITLRIVRRPETVTTRSWPSFRIDRRGRQRRLGDRLGAGIVPAAIEMMDRLDDRGGRGGVPPRLPRRRGGGAARRARRHRRAGRRGRVRAVEEICREQRRVRDPRSHTTTPSGRSSGRAARAPFAAMGRMSPDYYVQDGVVPRTQAAGGAPPHRRALGTSTASASATSSTPATATCTRSSSTTRRKGEAERAKELAEAILTPASTPAARSPESTASASTRPARCHRCSRSTISRPSDASAAPSIPDGPRQPRQGAPDAAAVRRGPGAVPHASPGEDRALPSVSDAASPAARGGGGAPARARAPRARRCGSVDDLAHGGLDRMLEHEAGDLTCTVEAGIRLSALARRARAARPAALARPARRPDGRCLPRREPLRARCATASARHATSCSASRSCSPTGRSQTPAARSSRTSRATTWASSSAARAGTLALIARVSLRLHPLPPAARARRRRDGDRGGAVVARSCDSQLAPERARRAASGAGRRALRGRRAAGRGAGRRGRGHSSAATRPIRASGPRRASGRAPPSARLRFAPGQLDARARGVAEAIVRARGRHRVRAAPRPSPTLAGSGASAERADPRRASTRTVLVCSMTVATVQMRATDARLRPLRLLPADLPDVPALERGDGLSARAHPADGGPPRRHGRAQPHRRRALRPLPRLHGLRLVLPVGRRVRPADRGDARHGRARSSARSRPSASLRALLFQASPLPAAHAASRCGSRRSGQACSRCRARSRRSSEIAPPWPRRRAPTSANARARRAASRASAFSRAASSRAVFGSVNTATARVLAADGYEVVAPAQGCCGALSLHAGRLEEGKAFARTLIEAFDGRRRAGRRRTPRAAART